MPQINIELIFQAIYNLFTGGPISFSQVFASLPQFLFWYKLVAYIVILLLVGLCGYVIFQINVIRAEQRKNFLAERAAFADRTAIEPLPKDTRWSDIVAKIQTENAADWKLAIIEADTLLTEMVRRMNYPGDSLGEWLKAVEPSDFVTLDDAWEAHKVRNQIAHDGGFALTKREATRVIGLYEKVFQEFSFI